MTETIILRLQEDSDRLDRALAVLLREKGLTRSMIQRAIADGGVTVDGIPARSSMKVHTGQEISITLPEKRPDGVAPLDFPLEILYEDRSCLVIDKPSGMVVHPAKGHWDDTLVNAMVGADMSLSTGFMDGRPGIVHRLDRDTSGVLLVAKNDGAQAFLAAQFKERTVKKCYNALVWGALERNVMEVDEPIDRDRKNRKKMKIGSGGREARTVFEVIEPLPRISLVRARPLTGRTHQIRVHLAHLHHPVVGDVAYGGHPENGVPSKILRKAVRDANRFFLHAVSIEFDSPSSGRVKVESPLPGEFRSIMEVFRSHE